MRSAVVNGGFSVEVARFVLRVDWNRQLDTGSLISIPQEFSRWLM
jgi:hypothetical protein